MPWKIDTPNCIIDTISLRVDHSGNLPRDSKSLSLGIEVMQDRMIHDSVHDSKPMQRSDCSRMTKVEGVDDLLALRHHTDIQDFLPLIKQHYEMEEGTHKLSHYTLVVG